MSTLSVRPAAGSRLGAAGTGTPGVAALAGASLLGLVGCSFVVVLIAAERPSFLAPVSRPGFFPAWMAGPLRGWWPGLTSDGRTLEWLVSGLLIAMFVLYLAAIRLAPRLPGRWTIATVLTIHAVFLLAPPLSYTDVFNYINYGRMGVVHHLNPYTVLPVAEPHVDPAFALSNWHHLFSPYGPLFTLLSYGLVPLGVVASFWALKLVVGLASLGLLALVWRCAELLGRSPVAAVVFVGCNPIVLVWGLGADHNDALMMILVTVAVHQGVSSRPEAGAPPTFGVRSAIALVAAAFIKAPAAVILPIVALAGPRRRRFLAAALGAGAALAVIALVSFGPHLAGLSTQSGLVTAIGIPNLVGLALGQGGETAGLHAGFTGLVALAAAACALWAWRRPAGWLRACCVALLALVVSLSWAAPWYVLWVLPFAALAGSRRLQSAVLVLSAYFLLAFMPAAVQLTSALGFRPAATALGLRHTARINALVR